MRFVLFYSGVESFNYFTDRIVEELGKRNHQCFILDLNRSNQEENIPLKRLQTFWR